MKQFLISLRKFGEDCIDLFKPKNSVRIIIRKGDDGDIVRIIEGRNVVTGFVDNSANNKSGRDFMRRLLIAEGQSDSFNGTYHVGKMAVGTGSTSEQSSDTGLASLISNSYQNVTLKTPLSGSLPEVTFSATWDANNGAVNGQIINEIGLYSNTVGSTTHFLARKTFTPFTKTADFSFTVEWTLRF